MDILQKIVNEAMLEYPATVRLMNGDEEISGGGYVPAILHGKMTKTGIEYPEASFEFDGPAGTVTHVEVVVADEVTIRTKLQKPFEPKAGTRFKLAKLRGGAEYGERSK